MNLIEIRTIQEPDNKRAVRPISYSISPEGCFNCISHGIDKDSYPRIYRNGKDRRMSRYIYTLFKGEIPPGLVVRHTCDNRLCVNPEHLIIGTVRDNVNDRMLRKGILRVQQTQNSTLTEDAVKFIRESPLSNSVLAKTLHVNLRNINNVRSKRTWKHVA